MAVRPLHQPTVAERLLLVDAVRLLGVEPLGCESPRIFVATHTSGG